MRTHLLRTFYRTPAAEPDTGLAANDAQYATSIAGSAPTLCELTRLTSPETNTPSSDDDYALGGYAGI